MDDRGHGTTTAPADPGRLKNWDVFVNDLERFFEHLDEPVIAMGHSRGAVSSMMVAIKRPDLVRAVILIDPTILAPSLNLLLLMTQKAGLTGFIPIVSGAAHRKRVWPDRQTILDAYRAKPSFYSWKDGFLEGYVRHCTKNTEGGEISLCCEPAWEARCFAVCPTDAWSALPRLQYPLWFSMARNRTYSYLQRQENSGASCPMRSFSVLSKRVISSPWSVLMKRQGPSSGSLRKIASFEQL